MKIQVQKMDNEQKRQFFVGLSISQREVEYSDANEALVSPIANKIFGFPWTEKVMVSKDSVVVEKQNWVDWEILEEPLSSLIDEHFSNYGEKSIEENPEKEKPQQVAQGTVDSPEAKAILSLIENEINPSLASHGGFVVLHSVEDGKAYLEMGGGCQGCAMSYMTLKEGIETAIKSHIPSIEQVIDVTDHADGNNPYYKKD